MRYIAIAGTGAFAYGRFTVAPGMGRCVGLLILPASDSAVSGYTMVHVATATGTPVYPDHLCGTPAGTYVTEGQPACRAFSMVIYTGDTLSGIVYNAQPRFLPFSAIPAPGDKIWFYRQGDEAYLFAVYDEQHTVAPPSPT